MKIILFWQMCVNNLLHFGHVSSFKNHVDVTLQRRKVADAVVDRDACGECNALLELFLLLETLGCFFQEHFVAKGAQFSNRRSNDTFINDGLDHSCKNILSVRWKMKI